MEGYMKSYIKKERKKRNSFEKRQTRAGVLFLLPNFVGFLLFTFIPVIAALVISFTNYDGFTQCDFVGFKNYMSLFKDSTFKISFWNNLYFTGVGVPLKIVLSILVALGLNRNMKGVTALRAAYFLPYISALVAVAVVWQALYHPTLGPINSFLMDIGVTDPPRWLSSTKWAMPSVIIVFVWRTMGYTVVLFLAGLQGIPDMLYEAAKIDGANYFQRVRYVTLPMLSPTTFFVTIISIISSFKVFNTIYIMTEGGPGRSTNIIVYNIYKQGFENFNFGYASAMSYVFFAMIMTITIFQFTAQKKWVNY